MINIPCRKCGSVNIRKNGLTGAGAQKYHCKACDFYGTLVTQEEKQKKKEELIEKLLCEHISQCGIARAARVSRNRVTDHKKKRTPSYRIGSCEDGKTSGCRNRQSAVIRGR